MIEKQRAKLISSGALQVPGAKQAEEPATEESAAVSSSPAQATEIPPVPGLLSEFATLLAPLADLLPGPRAGFFSRAIIICFPVLVTLFSDKAKEPIRNYSDTRQENVMEEIKEQQMVRQDQVKVGSAISGIIMFQVVLLSLMGSNNSAREIAGERLIYEKEKFAGLRPSAYLASKVAFLACLVIVQSLWMAFFVNFFGPFRGDFVQHAGFSADGQCGHDFRLSRDFLADAHAGAGVPSSIYLVGFQLRYPGRLLPCRKKSKPSHRPFICAYWAWSGSVEALQTRVHDAVKAVIDTTLSSQTICSYTLATHILAGLVAAGVGARRHQWD